MSNYRLEIEQLILSTILWQDMSNELDKCELEDYKLPYEIFKASRTTRLISKAIFNLQENKELVSELTVRHYLEDKVSINETEVTNLLSKLPVFYDSMIKYVKMLEDIDKEETKLSILKDLR